MAAGQTRRAKAANARAGDEHCGENSQNEKVPLTGVASNAALGHAE